jgi:hypothetical protein
MRLSAKGASIFNSTRGAGDLKVRTILRESFIVIELIESKWETLLIDLL